jgi:hypothetical protein
MRASGALASGPAAAEPVQWYSHYPYGNPGDAQSDPDEPSDSPGGYDTTTPEGALWLAVALVGSYERLMMVIRSSQIPAASTPETGRDTDPLQEQAAELFAAQLAADRVPSVRAIRAQLHVGQPRAQRLRDYLAAGAVRQVGRPAAVSSGHCHRAR